MNFYDKNLTFFCEAKFLVIVIKQYVLVTEVNATEARVLLKLVKKSSKLEL